VNPIPEDLYGRIKRVMPIPCVDLVVQDDVGRRLLLLRRNEPAAGQWWFPGGRVLHGERRRDAAERKLQTECGLVPVSLVEVETVELFLPLPDGQLSHGITTVYRCDVAGHGTIRLDDQTFEAAWHTADEWATADLHEFVRRHVGDD
jgi:ADP-ribose pyrophosphatase YjhB (NUDIX family)